MGGEPAIPGPKSTGRDLGRQPWKAVAQLGCIEVFHIRQADLVLMGDLVSQELRGLGFVADEEVPLLA